MLIHPQFDPVALSLGPLAIRWYGLMYLIAFLGFFLLGRWRLRQPRFAQASGLHPAQMEDLLFFGVLGVVLGGRLGYVLFYKPGYYLQRSLEALAVWEGGMSFHGGLLGVLVAIAVFCRWRGLRFLSVMDFIAPLVPLGLAAGRMGNFINGELWGRVSDVSWAMVFPQAGDALPRHPSQLYQFAGEGVALFVLLWWWSSRPRAVGAVSGMFLLGYAVFRFAAEFARQPDSFLGFPLPGITMGQILCVPMAVAGAWLLARSRRSA
ncbi:MAG: prolipoprotein diacylglyceryl transferase [Betaproteobacteria bacterium]